MTKALKRMHFGVSPYYKGPISDHFNGSRFYHSRHPFKHSFTALLKWKFTAKPAAWPRHKENHFFAIPSSRIEGSDIRATFVGHSTVLIQTQGFNIITDPVFSDYCSPFMLERTKRVHEPGIRFDQLPKIDIILISHNHYDHMDVKTIQQLWHRDKPIIVAPLGNDTIIQAHDSSIKVITLDWEQSKKIDDNLKVHLEPARHWSARGLWDYNKALWGAYVLETPGGHVYFAGDTGYDQGIFFHQAKTKFGQFRFAMLPIGAYEPRWFMKPVHMNPEEAVLAHKLLGEPYSMALHFATFRLADEGYEDPINDLAIAKQLHNISDEKFRALKIGEPWDIP